MPNEPLIEANTQILQFKYLTPFWERLKAGFHSINKIRTIPQKILVYYALQSNSFSSIQIRKYRRLILGSGTFISLNTIFYTIAIHNTAVDNPPHTKNPFLFLSKNNVEFTDLLNTVEEDILETEIEYLFTDENEDASNQSHETSSYLTGLTDIDSITKTALAILLCAVVIGAI